MTLTLTDVLNDQKHPILIDLPGKRNTLVLEVKEKVLVFSEMDQLYFCAALERGHALCAL